MPSKIKLIRSSTMKCLLNKDVKNSIYNKNTNGSPIYKRKEDEWELYMLDDFSIEKYPNNTTTTKKKNRFWSPIIVRWDLTYSCNFWCIHCYSNCSYDKKKHLSIDDAKKMIDIFDQEKIQFVQILWWEPMMYPWILDIIEYALSKNFIFCINSNWYLLNTEVIKKLSKVWLKYIQISLHWEEKEHIAITQKKDSFERVIKNIKELIKSDINISISCLVSNINKDTIFDFLEYVIKLWVKNIQLLTPLSQWRAKANNISLDQKDYNKLKKKLIMFKNTHTDINLDLPWFDVDVIDWLVNKEKNNPEYEFLFGCIWGISGIRVDPQWNACICVWWVSKPIANIIKEPMSEIMKKMYVWRTKNICKKCLWCKDYLKDCQGACYLRFKNDFVK